MRSTKLHLSTEPAFLPNACYRLVFFFFVGRFVLAVTFFLTVAFFLFVGLAVGFLVLLTVFFGLFSSRF